VKEEMNKSLRGEMTIVDSKNAIFSFKDPKFSQSVAALTKFNTRYTLSLTTLTQYRQDQNTAKTEKALIPILLCTAASTGDIEQLKYLVSSWEYH
jgi:hypothetical protein